MKNIEKQFKKIPKSIVKKYRLEYDKKKNSLYILKPFFINIDTKGLAIDFTGEVGKIKNSKLNIAFFKYQLHITVY